MSLSLYIYIRTQCIDGHSCTFPAWLPEWLAFPPGLAGACIFTHVGGQLPPPAISQTVGKW